MRLAGSSTLRPCLSKMEEAGYQCPVSLLHSHIGIELTESSLDITVYELMQCIIVSVRMNWQRNANVGLTSIEMRSPKTHLERDFNFCRELFAKIRKILH